MKRQKINKLNYLFLFILGSVLGSFLNLVVDRKIRDESIILPASHCTSCGHRLMPIDLIPILSYIFLKGRCRYCNSKIPTSNLIMEVITGILTVVLFDTANIFQSCLLILASYIGLVIAAIDLKTFDIYISHIGILFIIGLIYRYLYIGFDFAYFIKLIALAIIYGLIYHFSNGGLGDGDIYFYLPLTLFLENQLIIWFVLFSVWIGATYGILIALKHKTMKIEIPFCIHIYLAFLLVVILG